MRDRKLWESSMASLKTASEACSPILRLERGRARAVLRTKRRIDKSLLLVRVYPRKTKGRCYIPLRQVSNTGDSSLFAWIILAKVMMMPASKARCTRIFLRRIASGTIALSSVFLPPSDALRPAVGTGSCSTAGDSTGVDVPDMTSFFPLSPL